MSNDTMRLIFTNEELEDMEAELHYIELGDKLEKLVDNMAGDEEIPEPYISNLQDLIETHFY